MNKPPTHRFGRPNLVILAACVVSATLALADTSIADSDFPSFYHSALAFRLGQPLYEFAGRPDMNPPLLAVLLLPLTWLALKPAFMIWTAIGALALSWSLRTVYRNHVALNWWLVPGLTLLLPCWYVWRQGQLTWVLTLLVTQAWNSRGRSPLISGLWLAPAIAIKPPLALAVIWLGMPVVVTAAIGSALLAAVGLLATGVQPWLDWLGLAGQVNWLGAASNASLWGVAARVQTGHLYGVTLGDLRFASVAFVVAVSAGLARQVFRAAGDRRWVLAFLWSSFVSPLGWIYYLPLALGPILRSWKRSAALMAAIALFAMPRQGILAAAALGPIGARTAGCLCCAASLLIWLAWSRPARASQASTSGASDCELSPV